MKKPKKTLDCSLADMDTTLDVLNAALNSTTEMFKINLQNKGITDRATLNSHTWMEHLSGSIEFVEKIRAIQAGEKLL